MNLIINRLVSCRLPVAKLHDLARRIDRRYGSRRPPRVGELSLVVVDARTVRSLNRRYRGQDRPTDVLSFDYGEIVLCWPVAVAQARAYGLSVSSEVALLFVHGYLHILGFDHERPADRVAMVGAERRLLGESGLIGRGSRENVE